jgi:hypothetical protein
MIEQPATLSAGQRIASLRQFFRSRRADNDHANGENVGLEQSQWHETEWSETRFDPFAENA